MTKLWEILARKADSDWQRAPKVDWGPGAFTGAAEFRAHSSAVSMWKEPQEPVDGLAVLAERRAKLALGKAQEALQRAIARADRPLPCHQPGPDPVSEDRAERQQAAERCASCPVVTECGAVGAAMPLEGWGVFGGHDYGGDAEDLAELRAIGAQTFGGRGGAPIRARRDELFRALQGRWSVAELAAAAQTSDSTVRTALGYQRKPQTRRRGWSGWGPGDPARPPRVGVGLARERSAGQAAPGVGGPSW